MELLDKKNKVLKDWGLTFRSPGVWGGVGHGNLKQSLMEAGVPEEHLVSYSLVRRPLLIVDDIIESLSRPGGGGEWGLNKAEVLQTQKGWKRIKQGQTQAGAWIDNLESKIGKGKFRELFGKVIFEHQLAKQFGKDWSFLPRDYLLRGQVGNQAFNEMKSRSFDHPMMKKIQLVRENCF